ncbi:hypothetical protein BH10BAC5_BH10BAC5_23520 [soil metagenome]
MEEIVIKEFSVYLTQIRDILEKNSVPEKAGEEVVKIVSGSMNKLIELMKDGKSAHEKFFSEIILNSIDAIIGLDNNYNIILWNKGAEDIFGYKIKEITGKNFSILIPEDLIKEGEMEFIANSIKEKKILKNYESKRISKTGETLTVSISRFPIFNIKQEIIGSVGIVRDITNEKNLEKELREKENLSLVGSVVSSIAHSLANPLNIISGYTEYLLMSKKEGEKEVKELKMILEETQSISSLIRDILDFSRPIELKKEIIDLNELVSEIMNRLFNFSDEKKIKIIKTYKGNNFKIWGDKLQLKDAFVNLINNSIQSIKDYGLINISIENIKTDIILKVIDNGSGINKKDLPNIFLPFYSTKEYGKGTGLGLAITDKVIKLHNGIITVDSQINIGTTFTLKFPAVN